MEDLDVFSIEVGKPFTMKSRRRSEIMTDGAYLESMDFQQGFIYVIYYNRMNQKEQELFQNAPPRVNIFREGDFLTTFLEFGPLTMEVPFDPTLYPPEHELFPLNRRMVIVGVEGTTNQSLFMREISIPLKVLAEWTDTWASAYKNPNYSRHYEQWLLDLRSRYTLEQCLKYSKYVGKLGT